VAGRHPGSVAARLLIGLLVLIVLGWAAGEVWVASIGGAETSFMRSLAAERSQGLVEAARLVTWLGSLWLLVPCAVVACVLLVRAGLVVEAVALAVALLGAVVIADVTKALVDRPRPPVEHLQKVTSSSFPSTHSTQAGAFWFAAALALRRAGVRTVLLPAHAATVVLAVAFSRVYLGVHYPSDVTAGVLLGSAWAFYTARCLYGRRRVPG
jgi:undecaprenyl-diphosphatase